MYIYVYAVHTHTWQREFNGETVALLFPIDEKNKPYSLFL